MKLIIRYGLNDADKVNENRHPQMVMNEFSSNGKFTILSSDPYPIGDCWIFVIHFNEIQIMDLPLFLTIIGSTP